MLFIDCVLLCFMLAAHDLKLSSCELYIILDVHNLKMKIYKNIHWQYYLKIYYIGIVFFLLKRTTMVE